MGFAINPSLNHIDIPEKYILEIYQSSAEIVLPDARFRGHPCEAFICIGKVEQEMKAYVALLNNALKTTLVYTSDLIAKTPQEYPAVLAQAEEFVKSMGFTLHKVNLEFSPAMREVIIKGLRVMRPPPPQKRMPIRHPKVEVPTELAVSTGLNEPQPAEASAPGSGDGMTELLSLKTELASARAALERVTREKVATEQNSANERGALKAACEQAMESKRLAEERLSQAVRQLRKLEQATPPPVDNSELQRLQQQLGKAAANISAAEKVREQLQNELKGARQRVNSLGEEKVQLEKRLAVESQRVSALQQEATDRQRQLEKQLADARGTAAEAAAKLATMADVEQSWREAQQREEELRRRSATAEVELATARGELEELRQRLEHADELRQKLALSEAELVTVRQEITDLQASRNQAENTQEKLAATMAELAATREQLVASATEIERLHQEQGRALELQQTEATGDELAALQEELAKAREELKRLSDMQAAVAPAAGEVTNVQFVRLSEEKDAVEAEYVRLATESRETEATLSESLSLAEAEVERLTNELEIQGQVAAMEQAALRAELRRLIVEGGAAYYAPPAATEPLQPLQMSSAPHMAAQAAPPPSFRAAPPAAAAAPSGTQPVELPEAEEEVEDDTPDAPITAEIGILQEFTGDFGGFYGGGGASTTEFKIDPSVDVISYSDPAEVVAVFYSSNSVQAVPDGKGIQRCKGYIVATKSSGSYRIYVAWYLTESGRVVVCLPEQQPADSEECVLILKDAVSYFEIVGFMMEVVDLGGTQHSYRKALKKIPVMKKISP